MITVVGHVTGVDELARELTTFLNTEGPKIAAPIIRTEIIQDASKSKGYDGELWPLYTPAYEKRKKKLNRSVGKPDLWLTGDMLTSLHLDTKKELTVSAEEMPKARGNSRYRKFIGVSVLARLKARIAIVAAWNKKVGLR